MRPRVICAGRFRLGGERRGLRDVQVADRFSEEHLRGRLDAGHVGAEVDLVQIQLENRVLRKVALQLQRHARFPELTRW